MKGMELRCGILEAPPAGGVNDLHRVEFAGKSPLYLMCREEDRGKTLYMAGRWRNSSPSGGPWSAIISVVIP
jgi:hypothetical protein